MSWFFQLVSCFWGSSMFSWVAAQFFNPTSNLQGFQFLYILANSYYLLSFFITVILVDVKWHFFVFLTCISLMANDVWYFFMCLLAIWITYLKKFLFNSISHGTFVEYKSSLYSLDTGPLCQIYDLQIFSPIMGLSFCFLTPV